jgi:hypothetical protein
VGVLASEPVYTLLRGYVPQLDPETCEIQAIYQCEMQMIVAGAIALVIIGVFSMVFALFAPKQNKLVSQKVLAQEKQAIDLERRRAKKRKYQMRQKMRKANKGKDY